MRRRLAGMAACSGFQICPRFIRIVGNLFDYVKVKSAPVPLSVSVCRQTHTITMLQAVGGRLEIGGNSYQAGRP
jgi:hypothetical protein